MVKKSNNYGTLKIDKQQSIHKMVDMVDHGWSRLIMLDDGWQRLITIDAGRSWLITVDNGW